MVPELWGSVMPDQPEQTVGAPSALHRAIDYTTALTIHTVRLTRQVQADGTIDPTQLAASLQEIDQLLQELSTVLTTYRDQLTPRS